MKKEYIGLRMDEKLHRNLNRIAGRLNQSKAETSRLLVSYALEQVQNDPILLLDHAQKQSSQR